MTTLRAILRQNMVTGLVQRAILCPVTGQILDVRTCVVLVDSDGDPAAVLSQDGYRNTPAGRLVELGLTADPDTVRPAGGSADQPAAGG